MFHSLRSSPGFTLIEMIVVMGIMSFMSVVILSVYTHITDVERKLEVVRLLQESAREVTERIAKDVREHGIATSWYEAPLAYPLWMENHYTGSGNEILIMSGGTNVRYIYGKKTAGTLEPCNEDERKDTSETFRCSLYLVENNDYQNSIDLIDMYRIDPKEKRVRLENMRFYISGQDQIMEGKVTLVMTLALTRKSGISGMFLEETKIRLQTTISERAYKNYQLP